MLFILVYYNDIIVKFINLIIIHIHNMTITLQMHINLSYNNVNKLSLMAI